MWPLTIGETLSANIPDRHPAALERASEFLQGRAVTFSAGGDGGRGRPDHPARRRSAPRSSIGRCAFAPSCALSALLLHLLYLLFHLFSGFGDPLADDRVPDRFVPFHNFLDDFSKLVSGRILKKQLYSASRS